MDARSVNPITMTTPLGAALMFHSMGGVEGLSMPFHFEVEATSSRADIHARDLLGESITVHIDLGQHDESRRHWNGRVTGFDYLETGDDGLSRYRLAVRPWIWQLGLSADCRIFQNLTVPDIVEQIFRHRGFTDFERSLLSEYDSNEYIVQYRESDLHFVSRLLEREGIYYFFRHEDGKHTLVLADSPHAHDPARGYETLPYAANDENRDQTMQYVRRWRAESQLETARYSLADFDFTKPRVPLYGSDRAEDDDFATDSEVYDYPGGFDGFPDASRYARVRLEEARRDGKTWVGETNARGLAVAGCFRLDDHPRHDENRGYLVTSARVRLRGTDATSGGGPEDEPFACTFRAVADDVTFRPSRRAHKPTVRGPQTATVVGPQGQEIWTDRYGRVKVQFHWDRNGKSDQMSSCWIRVAQAWAGIGWGAQFIPRVGDEVIVNFLEGDVDKPIITGSVYNGANATQYALPANQTQSGFKSRSSPGGSVLSGNEIRFEDLTGNEDLYIHAERTQTTVINDSQTITVGRNRSLSVSGVEMTAVALERSLSVGAASSVAIGGDASETVGGMRRVAVGGQNIEIFGLGSSVDVGGSSNTRVGGVAQLEVGAALRVAAAGDESHTTGGTLDVRVGGAASYSYAAPTKDVSGHPDAEVTRDTFVYGTRTIHVTKDVVLHSETSITLRAGDTQVLITPDGVTIKGKTLELDAGSKFSVASPNASLTLDDDVAGIGKKVTLSSNSAQLALASDAQLVGSQVKLGSGGGGSASSSAKQQKQDDKNKPMYFAHEDPAQRRTGRWCRIRAGRGRHEDTQRHDDGRRAGRTGRPRRRRDGHIDPARHRRDAYTRVRSA